MIALNRIMHFSERTTMNRTNKALLAFIGAMAVSASQANDFEDYARVINVRPQVEQVNQPRQQCWMEQVPVQPRQQRGFGGAVVGGLAGGLLGSQIGGGSGRTAATAVGALTGAIVGDRMENQDHQPAYPRQIQRCQMVDHWETRNRGYLVTYVYRGHTQTAVMPYEPGHRIPVRVSVTPRV
jgi:uncharacterized protein YcfJ